MVSHQGAGRVDATFVGETFAPVIGCLVPMNPALSAAKARAVGLVRRGDRTVLWTPPRLGFGNHLYFYLQAHLRRARGDDVVVLEDPAMAQWFAAFPRLAGLVVAPAEVRLRDVRELGFFQRFGTDFTASQLAAFVEEALLSGTELGERAFAEPLGTDTVTLNIRRGDYYSVTTFRGMYSFDIAEYLRVALVRQQEVAGAFDRIRIVSDDPAWCRVKLTFLSELAEVTYADHGRGAWGDLLELARSPRLVLTNSTFSYWGAHLSNQVHPETYGLTVAPWFHRRDIYDGWAWFLDPRWSIVEDIPGGWDG